MYNNKITIHNKYTISVIKNEKVIHKIVKYNNANSKLFVNQVLGNSTNNVAVTLIAFNTEREWTFGSNCYFYKNTDSDFNKNISYSGSVFISNINITTDDENELSWKVGLGSRVADEDGVYHYWSEVNIGNLSDIDETVRLQMDINLNFYVYKPGFAGVYVAEQNAIFGGDVNSFPRPLPSTNFSISPLIKYPQQLIKKIPTVTSLPSRYIVPQYERKLTDPATYCQQNNSSHYAGLVVLNDGKANNISSAGSSGLNRGLCPTIVYNNVGAWGFSMSMKDNKEVPIPIAILDATELDKIIGEDTENGYVYFYASNPGTTVSGIYIDGLATNSSYSWVAPPQRLEINGDSILGAISSSDYDTTPNNNLYYANFILSAEDYWEPSSANGSKVAPKYVNLSVKPTNYRMGSNIKFSIEGKNLSDEDWTPCKLFNPDSGDTVGSIPFKTYYLQNENYDNYRVCFTTIPNTNAIGYYVNEAEKQIIPNKIYDKNVVLIGTSTEIYDDNGNYNINRDDGKDFGRCGLRIPKNELITLRERLGSKNNSKQYYITAGVKGVRYFYKTSDIISVLNYGVSAG